MEVWIYYIVGINFAYVIKLCTLFQALILMEVLLHIYILFCTWFTWLGPCFRALYYTQSIALPSGETHWEYRPYLCSSILEHALMYFSFCDL